MSVDCVGCNPKVLEYRLDVVESAIAEIKEAVKSIDKSLDVIARIEEKHLDTREALGRAFKCLEGHEERIKAIEMEIPTLQMMRNWIISGVLGIVALVGIAMIGYFLHIKQ
ncbi:MAG: hypothetical protein QY317_16115 [Candidatus Jettenia caeni]|nr:MAG: hypothetical protein QY317_16115 [Candidatus Jettenia caeni]